MPVDRRVRAASVATALTLLVALFSVDYTVKPGDTLGAIARDNDVSVSDLAAANHISNPNLIRAGQVLVIPSKDRTHVVARGESLYTIAKKYGTTVAALIKANKLDNPNLIRPDQKLVVPGSAEAGGREAQVAAVAPGAPTATARLRSPPETAPAPVAITS